MAYCLPEKAVVGGVDRVLALSAEAEIEFCAASGPREVEGSRVEELAQLDDALLVLRCVAQRYERSRRDAEDVCVVYLADRYASGNQYQVQHRFFA